MSSRTIPGCSLRHLQSWSLLGRSGLHVSPAAESFQAWVKDAVLSTVLLGGSGALREWVLLRRLYVVEEGSPFKKKKTVRDSEPALW